MAKKRSNQNKDSQNKENVYSEQVKQSTDGMEILRSLNDRLDRLISKLDEHTRPYLGPEQNADSVSKEHDNTGKETSYRPYYRTIEYLEDLAIIRLDIAVSYNNVGHYNIQPIVQRLNMMDNVIRDCLNLDMYRRLDYDQKKTDR